jgi:hypothetical protein
MMFDYHIKRLYIHLIGIYRIFHATYTSNFILTMTPYVELQEAIISIFTRWLNDERRYPILQDFAQRYCLHSQTPLKALTDEDRAILTREGFREDEWWALSDLQGFSSSLLEIVVQQINIDQGLDKIEIRELLGHPLSPRQPMDYPTYIANRGSGMNLLRTEFCANPAALIIGDILASGETVCELPREGGNGSVLVRLSTDNGKHKVWLKYPARTVLALLPAAGNPPPEGLVH